MDRVLAPHLKVEALSVEKDAMQSMALDLLRITNEDRNLMGYVLGNLDCQHHENLADSFIMAVAKNGLDCQLEIRHADGVAVTQRATHGIISPLEASLFSNRPEQSGVFVFKRRLLINRHDVSVLITNFPENSDTAERLKANLVILVEATEHLINTVSMRRTATLTTESLQVAALNAHETTRNLQENYHQQQADTQILLYGLIEKVEKSYFSMGLTEGQEARISHILRHEAEEVLDLFRHGAEKLDLKFSEIMSVLSPPKKDTGDVWL